MYNSYVMYMKVLSIKEPFATLIKDGIKQIETRSWKTNYRGKLFIHASLTKNNKSIIGRNELLKLIENKEMNYGNIICECELVDCIYMDEKFLNEIKNNHIEYICGHYDIGRYAWIFTNVKPIKPIPAKGRLGIWNY